MISPQLSIQITFISFVFHSIHSILLVHRSISHNSNDMPIIINSNNNVMFSSKHVLSYVSSNFPLHNGAVFSHFSRFSIRMCALCLRSHCLRNVFNVHNCQQFAREPEKVSNTHGTTAPSLSIVVFVCFFSSTLSTTCMGKSLGQRMALKCHESNATQRMTCFR